MITKDTSLRRYLIAVAAPEGVVFTVYAEDPENRIRFQQNIVRVIQDPDPAWWSHISYGLCSRCHSVHGSHESCKS